MMIMYHVPIHNLWMIVKQRLGWSTATSRCRPLMGLWHLLALLAVRVAALLETAHPLFFGRKHRGFAPKPSKTGNQRLQWEIGYEWF